LILFTVASANPTTYKNKTVLYDIKLFNKL